MTLTDRQREIVESIEEMRNDIVETVSRLVKIRSVNPGYPGTNYDEELGGETEANKFLSEFYRQMDLEVDLWEEDKGRTNLVGIWKGAGGGRSLIHNGHIDTVPLGRIDAWESGDPLSGKVEGGKIYGRGSCDMKGPVVAQMFAIQALQRVGVQLAGDVILSSTVGEENMDSARIGAGSMVKRGYSADAAVVSEPSGPPYSLAAVPTSPGLWWVTVTVKGKASHAATRGETIRAGGLGAEVAVNAIDKGVLLINAIRALEDEWGLEKKHPLFKPGHFTLLPGVISGGPHGVHVPFFISDYCTIEYCIWHHPDEDAECVKEEFSKHVYHATQMDPWLRKNPPKLDWKVHWPPFSIDVEHPICQAVMKAHEQAAVGTKFEGPTKLAGFYAVCDAAFLQRDGVPAIVYGPGSLLAAHAPDEHVEIEELITATKTYALLTLDWCGESSG